MNERAGPFGRSAPGGRVGRAVEFHGPAALAGRGWVTAEVHAAGGRMGLQFRHVGSVAVAPTEWAPPGPVESPSDLAAPGGGGRCGPPSPTDRTDAEWGVDQELFPEHTGIPGVSEAKSSVRGLLNALRHQERTGTPFKVAFLGEPPRAGAASRREGYPCAWSEA